MLFAGKLSRRSFFKRTGMAAGSMLLGNLFSKLAILEAWAQDGYPPTFRQVFKVDQITDPLWKQKLRWYNVSGLAGDPAQVLNAKKFEEYFGCKTEGVPVAHEKMADILLTDIRAGTSEADVWQFTFPTLFSLYIQNHGLEEISDFATTQDAWVPSMKEALTFPQASFEGFGGGPSDFPYRKGLYGIPVRTLFWGGCFYNKIVFKKAGLDPEKDLETVPEFLDALRKIKRDTKVKYPLVFPYSAVTEGVQIPISWFVRFGGREFDEKGNPQFDSPEYLEMLKFMNTLVKEKLVSKGILTITEGEATASFYRGEAAVMFNSQENILFTQLAEVTGKGFEKEFEGKVAWDVARTTHMPTLEGIGYRDWKKTFSGCGVGECTGVPIMSKRKRAAAIFADFLSYPDCQAAEFLIEGNLPIRADIFDLPYVREGAPYPEHMKEALENMYLVSYPNMFEILQARYEEITEMINGVRTPEETQERIQSRVKSILSR
ncbi:MAG: carbohydrate ABC transporter substrate-binding protein [Nitrospinota bacterium]|nr:MAG: carbohydrate ABC transporter substrate-binding protein [Nitrospinota bacterium]